MPQTHSKPQGRPKNLKQEVLDLLTVSQDIYRSEPETALQLATKAHKYASASNWTSQSAAGLLVMSGAHHVLGNYKKADALALQALKLMKDSRNTQGIGDALHRLAGIRFETGNYLEAQRYALDALKVRRDKGDMSRVADTLAILTTLHLRQSEFAKALEYALEELEAAEQSGPRQRGAAFLALGRIYEDIGYPDLAESYFERAIEGYSEAKDTAGTGSGHYHLGKHYLTQGSEKQAEEHLQQALSLFESIHEKLGQVRALTTLSSIPNRARKKNALQQLERALSLARAIDQSEVLAEVLISLSRLPQRENSRTKKYLLEGLKLARSIDYLKAESEALELLAICFEREGNLKKALEMQRLHTTKRLDLLRHETSLELKAVQVRRELESIRSQAELHRLRADDLAEKVNEKEKNLSIMALHLIEKQAFIGHLKRHLQSSKDSKQGLSQLVGRLEKEVQDQIGWNTFQEEFEHLSGGFVRVLSSRHPDLTSSELKVCSLLRIGLSSKRIGGMLHISSSTVDTHRKHIRSKLKLEDRKSLMSYLTSLS